MVKLDMVKFSRKIILSFFLSAVIFSGTVSAGVYGSQQLLPAGHWIYDTLFILNSQAGKTSLADNAPLSAAEIKMHLNEIPYDKLSYAGRILYEQAQEFFSEKEFTVNLGPAFFGFNLVLNPELLYKSNSEIPWTFGTDYTGGGAYGAESGFWSNSLASPFITLPVYLGFADLFFIETDPIFAKSYWGMTTDWNFTNIAYDFNDFEFMWPKTAYGSTGKAFNKWGFNIHIAKQGLQIGRTQTGSIIYNSTFQTDAYVQLNLYSPHVKYSMDTVQIQKDKFMYLHSLEIAPFKWLKAGIVEGMLINKPFELRFLNPLMIMHSFGAWTEYLTEDEDKYYGEAHVCAYMGIHVDIVPCRYLRIYGLYAQNEIQSPIELESATGRAMPDSLGGQLGFELTIPDNKYNGWWIGTLEAIYTTPFLYIKQGADWSLYRERYNMQSNGSTPLCSWIGTPFGPDCIGFQARAGYSQIRKWSAEIDYLFAAHGTNSFGLFGKYVEKDGVKYYTYYPSVLYKIYEAGDIPGCDGLTAEAAEEIARKYSLTGTVQFTNQVTLKGRYLFNDHMTLGGQATYSFIFNNNNQADNFQHGVEIALFFTYSIF